MGDRQVEEEDRVRDQKLETKYRRDCFEPECGPITEIECRGIDRRVLTEQNDHVSLITIWRWAWSTHL